MGRLVRRRAGYALLLAGLFALAGCGDPTLRSEIGPTIDALSFEPPARSRATAGDGQRTGAPQGRPRPEVFLARGAVALVPRPPGVQRTPDGVQVNLDGAEVKEAVRVVLGDILRRPFTIDPRVSGTVTLSTAGPVAERDLLLVLETALRMVGAGLAESGPGFVVAPAEELVGRSELRPIGGSQPPLVAPGTGATVVPLRHISAQTAAQFVQPLLNKPEDIRVDPSSNLLLITGTAAERQAALDTLAVLDADWLANRSVGIFPLQYATPEALIPELEALFAEALPPGTGQRPAVQFLPIARLNAVLALTGSPAQMLQVEQWVGRLDRGRTAGPQFFVYELKHANAEDAAKLLAELFGEAAGAAPAAAATPPSLLGLGAPPEGRPTAEEPATGPAALAAQEARISTVRPAGSGGIKVVANKATNSVVVRATPAVWEQVEGTLRRIDTAPPQVLIEATIAEVLLNDALRYGVQYFIEAGNFRFGFNNTTGSATGTTNFRNLEPLARVPGFNFIFTGGDTNITIDALSQVTGVPTDFPGYPRGTRALQLPDSQVSSYFLTTFGRPPREQTCSCERQEDPSLIQALHLRNGATLNEKLRARDGRIDALLDRQASDAEVLSELFLAALCREPTEDERRRILPVLAATPADGDRAARRAACEDLFWAVLTSKEFLFNH